MDPGDEYASGDTQDSGSGTKTKGRPGSGGYSLLVLGAGAFLLVGGGLLVRKIVRPR